ncbi:hypothetical protein ACQCPQ_12220 [Priestia megaterium]|uniref:hypothetical protein n=1 Tax=Priestia megaterium TaxID=1404 RepID=UPI003CFD5749
MKKLYSALLAPLLSASILTACSETSVNGKNVGVGTATLTQKDQKIRWYFNGNPAIIKQSKGNTDITSEITTPKGVKYDFYAGTPTKSNMTIETRTDTEAVPHIDKEYDIYYYLSPVPRN